ncbi:tyrosine phosphatase-like protein [Lipomyces japonicus]|uniref:tyrosine phosphatase-like protein n=1 Tax=Lipomyces japonicus TaxID=56871 RepID=UPI0034CFA103
MAERRNAAAATTTAATPVPAKSSSVEDVVTPATATATTAAASSGSKPTLTSTYLLAYNTVSAFLWAAVFLRVILILPILGAGNLAGGVANFSKWVQTGAVLEIVHAAIGIVRSPVLTTALQVASRLLLVWGVVDAFPAAAGPRSIAYATMLASWSVTEVIRYSYYAYNLRQASGDVTAVPAWLVWLRYNTFFLLYPTGVSSELLVTIKSLPAIAEVSSAYSWLLKIVLVIYLPAFYVLFTHMIKQRRRVFKNLGKRRQV